MRDVSRPREIPAKLSCLFLLFLGAALMLLPVDGARAAKPSVYWGAWIDGESYGDPDGDAPWDFGTWGRFERNAGGKRVSIVHFGQPAPWAQSFRSDALARARKRGAIPLMDMDTADTSRGGHVATLRQIARGRWDQPLRRWARRAARYGAPFFLRLNWEMNGRWFPWGAEAAAAPRAYVRSWRRFHRIAARAGAGNVTWVWCPNAVFRGTTPLRRLYPGDRFVDWTCMDGYNKGRHAGQTPNVGWQSFRELFGATYRRLLRLAPHKPIMIGETGSTEVSAAGPSPLAKARWIRDAFSVQLPRRFPRIKAVTWFNWNIDEGVGERWDWPIESSGAARRAFARAISARYYAENRFGQLRRHTKIRALR